MKYTSRQYKEIWRHPAFKSLVDLKSVDFQTQRVFLNALVGKSKCKYMIWHLKQPISKLHSRNKVSGLMFAFESWLVCNFLVWVWWVKAIQKNISPHSWANIGGHMVNEGTAHMKKIQKSLHFKTLYYHKNRCLLA